MRIGVIGLGVMGGNHLRAIRSVAGLQLTCAADLKEENRAAAARQYGIPVFPDFRSMIGQVDAVMVSTPTSDHHAISSFFLEQGKHVLVEKPISETVAQADDLIAIAGRRKVVLAVGHLERFNPAVEYLQDLVDHPRFIEVQRLGSFSPRSLDIDVILDLMIHDLDIILQWDRTGVREIRAIGIPVISPKIDIANVRLEFRSGMVATLTASRVSQEKTRKLRIFQKDMYVSADYKQRRVKIMKLQNRKIIELVPDIKDVEPLINLWTNFCRTAMTGRNFNVTGEEGRNALDLAIAIGQSIGRQN
jgi:predicted dehydrogenase